MGKVRSTIPDCVDYVLKEKEGGQLLISSVGNDRDSIVSFFENQQKEYGKNSISTLIVAQHCNHQISNEKWIELWYDIFEEMNLVNPQCVVGKHNDGSQAHCHSMLAKFRPNQYLNNDEFRPNVPSKEFQLDSKKNRTKLDEKLFGLARKLEVKHNLPAMALSIHFTREYWIPSIYRYKDRQREMIDKALESAKTFEEFRELIKEISSQEIPKFQKKLLEDKKISYYDRIKDATEMTFESRKWCNNEFVFTIGGFACRGILLGPQYSRDAIERRIEQNFAKAELTLQQPIEIKSELKPDIQKIEPEKSIKIEPRLKPDIQELKPEQSIENLAWLKLNIHELKPEETIKIVAGLNLDIQEIQSKKNCEINELIDSKIVEQLCDGYNKAEANDNVFQNELKLELSIYDRIIDQSLEIKNNQLELKNVWCEIIELTLFTANQVKDTEIDKAYELRMDKIKNAEIYLQKQKEIEISIQKKILALIILHEESLKRIEKKRLLAEKNNQKRIAKELLRLTKEKEKSLEAQRAKVDERLCLELKLSDSGVIDLILTQRINLSIKLMNNSLKLILSKNGYLVDDKGKGEKKEVKNDSNELNNNLRFLLLNMDKSKLKCLKEFQQSLIRIETYLLPDEAISNKNIEFGDKQTMKKFSYFLDNNFDNQLQQFHKINESRAKNIRLDFANTIKNEIMGITHYISIKNLNSLTHGINSLILVLDRGKEIDKVVKNRIVDRNNEFGKELKREKLQQALIKRITRIYPRNNDRDQSQGLELTPP